jgi:hypothetical protein
MRKSTIAFAFLGLLGLATVASADIPFFWLDKPTGRSNPNDPNSPNRVVTPLPVAPGGSPTNTPPATATRTMTPTYTFGNTATPTQSPSHSPTANGTFTYSPTMGSTFTSTPSPSASPTFTATPTQPSTCVTAGVGPSVIDFENTNCGVTEYGEGVWVSVDGSGSTASPATWAAGSQIAPPGSGNSSSRAGCMSGSMVQEVAPTTYPYTDLQLPLAVAPATVNVGPHSTNNGLSFKFRAAVAGVQYKLMLQQGFADPYQIRFTPNNTNWNTYNVYFPGVSTSGLKFAQPSWAAAQPWTTNISRIDVGPVASVTGALPYDFCIDDVTFNLPVAPAPYPATLLLSAEYGIGTDEWGGTMSASDIDATSTITGYQGAGSTLPGGTSLGSFCINGSIGAGVNPYAVGIMRLNAAGTAVNISTASTNQSVKFSYKANTLKTFRIRVTSPSITDYDYYHFDITPTDTAWHEQVIYFPGTAPAAQCFAQGGWGAAIPWATVAADVISMDIMVFDPAGAYDVCIDDFNFDAPAGPGGGTPGSWPVVVDGDTVPLGTNFYTINATANATEVSGSGAGGSASFISVTMSSLAGGFDTGAAFVNGFSGAEAVTKDASAYTSLSISVRVPSTGGNCLIPGISLATYDGSSKTSAAISVEPYLVGGAKFMAADTWYTALIPVSAFQGFNGKPAPNDMTITAADLGKLVGVVVQPFNYGNTGAFTGAVDVDDIKFTNDASTLLAGHRSGLLADFENGTGANWGGYWSANVDAFTCPGYSVPPTLPNLSAITYAGITDTAGGTGSATPCNVGRLAGWLGAFNGPWGAPACGPTDYPYLNMSVNLTNDGAAHTLADNSFIGTLPPSGATGMRFKLKLGPTLSAEMAGQLVKVFIEKTTAKEGDQFLVQVAVSDLSTSAWVSYDVPFPTGAVATRHADQGSEGTVLEWKKSQYAGGAAPDAFDLTDVIQVGFGPIVRGKGFDVLIDDIEFY